MRSGRLFCLMVAGLMGAAAGTATADDYDTPLAQQILASVQNYRRSLQEMQQLEKVLQGQKGVQDIFDSPTMKNFMRDSVNPSYAQLKDLLGRYREEVGDKSLQIFAATKGFTDLLKTSDE